MTDNEIIKALESEIHLAEYVDSDYCSNVNLEIIKSALDLINRQKAEIERLKIENQSLRGAADSYKLHYNEARNEAVKEFADRLQIRCIQQDGCLWSSDIGAELKEMVGDTK